jgi:hypothetical protein
MVQGMNRFEFTAFNSLHDSLSRHAEQPSGTFANSGENETSIGSMSGEELKIFCNPSEH